MISRLLNGLQQVRRGRVARGFALIAAAATLAGTNLGAGCFGGGGANSSSIDVPLIYIPRNTDETPQVRLPPGALVKVQIGDTEDKRDEAERRSIGRNVEDAQPIPVYGTGGSVAGFVNKVIQQEVKASGLSVTDDMAVTTRRLASDVKSFEVTEGGSYKGSVQLGFRVIDQTGKPLFDKVYTETSGNHGRSKSAENYQQTFSDAVRQAVLKLLADPDFAASLVDERQ
jgi:hypothetical protein